MNFKYRVLITATPIIPNIFNYKDLFDKENIEIVLPPFRVVESLKEEELIEIVPSAINKIWATKYPTVKRPNAKPKENISVTLKSALKVLEDLQNICESKNPQKIAKRITDEDAGVIGAYTLIDFAMIRPRFYTDCTMILH